MAEKAWPLRKPGLFFRVSGEDGMGVMFVTLVYGSLPIYRLTFEEFEEVFGFRAASTLIKDSL